MDEALATAVSEPVDLTGVLILTRRWDLTGFFGLEHDFRPHAATSIFGAYLPSVPCEEAA
jgi:hypothetical protein